jgi:hypothetical protein
VNPELIPRPGVLFHLSPRTEPDEFWVNSGTYGIGQVIGWVARRDDERWDVHIAGVSGWDVRDVPDAEYGMWLCVRDWLMHGRHSPLPCTEPVTKQAEPASRETYGFGTAGLAGRLEPGDRILRELTAVSDEEGTTEMPCCGRLVTLPLAGEPGPAACCRCQVLYEAVVVNEEPDGWSDEPLRIAVFTVASTALAVAQHRKGKWERH